MLVIALTMLIIVVVAALVMAHVALPELRRGNTVFVGDGETGQGTGRISRVATRLKVPAVWNEPRPRPRHAR